VLSSLCVAVISCDDDDNPTSPTLDIPTTYISANYDANSVTEKGVRDGLGELSSAMKAGRSGATVNTSDLTSKFATVRSITTLYYAGKVDNWLTEIANASGGQYNSAAMPSGNGQGGVLGSYLLDENGIELEQLVEKGLFGAALYSHALSVMTELQATPNPDNVDKIVQIWGAHPSFQNSDKAENNKDVFAAKYAARRDKNDGNGYYTKVRDALIKAKAAAGDASFNTELTEAIADIKLNWEKSQMATVINYCQAAISKLSATSLDDAARGSGLHSYSEGVGFLHGWKTIPQSDKVITDAQIDELLGLMLAPHNSAATSYRFLLEPTTTLPQLQQVIDRLQTIYSFTDQEITDFEKNWVNEQSR
jgi:hypothetical protein